MLKYMPLYGSILLTVIILWIIASTIIGNRRKIGDALAGRTYLTISDGNLLLPENRVSVCCGAPTFRPRWSADGWIAGCQMCGEWQYLGDDYEHPPVDALPSYDDSRRSPGSPPDAASGPGVEGQFGVRPTCTCDTIRYINGDHLPDCPTQSVGFYESTPGAEVTSDELPYYPHQKAFASARIAFAFGDDGEDMLTPPLPNIGGEGHPEYKGPHYIVPHDRFVPYDVLRDPPEGAAVHIVGNVACVGPLEVEAGDRGHADTVREEDES
jgi:hypothetical protein